MWVTITTCNKMGRKPTINRCLLYPLSPLSHSNDKFLVLGCHFGRKEAPFCYDATKNKYVEFQHKELSIDMYRSNDVVQFHSNYMYLRPFVKVGEPSESVKVYKYFIDSTPKEDTSLISCDTKANGPDKKQAIENSSGIKRTSSKLSCNSSQVKSAATSNQSMIWREMQKCRNRSNYSQRRNQHPAIGRE